PDIASLGHRLRCLTRMGPSQHSRDKTLRAVGRAVRHLPRSARILATLARRGLGRGMRVPSAASAMAVLASQKSPWRFDVLQVHYGPMGIVVDALREHGLVVGPMVVTFHGSDVSVWPRGRRRPYASLFERAERFTANSEFLRQRLVRLGAPAARTRLLPVGIDVAAVPARSDDPSSPARLITVGRLAEEKGIEQALRALAVLRDRGRGFRYTVIGGGPLGAALERLTATLRLEKQVDFLGPLPHGRVLETLSAQDIFLLPGVESSTGAVEAQGRVLVEAQAAGLAIVASRVGGVPETVGDGAGVLVSPGDVAALADAIEHLLDDPPRLAAMGRRGRAHVERRYAKAHLLDRLQQIYFELA
ncbi:MAG: glycosyltransferase, partial [Gemmatimonadota bacterium]